MIACGLSIFKKHRNRFLAEPVQIGADARHLGQQAIRDRDDMAAASAAWNTFKSSRGLAQRSLVSARFRTVLASDWITGTGSRPVSAIRPAKTDRISGLSWSTASRTDRHWASVIKAVTFN